MPSFPRTRESRFSANPLAPRFRGGDDYAPVRLIDFLWGTALVEPEVLCLTCTDEYILGARHREFQDPMMNEQKTVEEISIPVGDLHIRMLAPQDEADSDSRITFWWGITSAAVALARHIESHVESFSGKRVIELGCGLGLAGITAGLAGANVLFTDYMPQALEFAEKNARLNRLANGTFRAQVLDWEYPADLPKFDVVLGTEIVYDYFFHGALIRLLQQIVRPQGAIFLADRKRLCVSRFIGRMTASGFRPTEATSRVELPGFPDQEISIFTLSRL